MSENDYIVVVGGVNIDVGGRSDTPLVARDSNPGRVTISLGGVGRNIAHNLSLMGVKVFLLTALGDDRYADLIRSTCRDLGIDLSLSLTVTDHPTSTYLYIENSDGDLALAVTDTRLCDRITPAYLGKKLDFLNGAKAVFADANLTADALAYLGESCSAPLFTDPVSTKKAPKVAPILNRIHTLKPNLIEAERLSGITITDDNSLDAAVSAILSAGTQRVFLSLGERGVYAADRHQRVLVPPVPGTVRSTNGAGDAFTAALGWAYLNGLSLENTCRAANAAAAITLESELTNSPGLSADAVLTKLNDEGANTHE